MMFIVYPVSVMGGVIETLPRPRQHSSDRALGGIKLRLQPTAILVWVSVAMLEVESIAGRNDRIDMLPVDTADISVPRMSVAFSMGGTIGF